MIITDLFLYTDRKAFDQAVAWTNTPSKHKKLNDCMAILKDHAFKNLQVVQLMLQKVEVEQGIKQCWSKDSPEYIEAARYLASWDYKKALNKLEGLVVQRLFELAKVGLSGTGMISHSDVHYYTTLDSFSLFIAQATN